MAVTILEALENAEHNVDNLRMGINVHDLIKMQIHNSRILLEKGYDPHDYVEDIMLEYDKVENVPDKE